MRIKKNDQLEDIIVFIHHLVIGTIIIEKDELFRTGLHFEDIDFRHTWMIIKRQIPGPRSEGSPYIPVMTYTTA